MNRTMLSLRRSAGAAVLLCAISMAPECALAQNASYLGTWATKPAQCRLGQAAENAPLVMKRNRYDQHETHCTFKSVRPRGPAWAVKAQCMVEGDTQEIDLTLQVS